MPETKVICTIQVTLDRPLTQLQINEIICTAFEGGIDYWCAEARLVEGTQPSDPTSDEYYSPEGFRWELYDTETGQPFSTDDYENYIPLTLDSLKEGIKKYAEWKKTINFLEDMDAEVADCIIQFAVFDEIIFG